MRIVWRVAALVALVLVGSCDEKDSDFFTTVVGGGDGTLGLAVNGVPAGATVTVTRNGSTIFSDVVGATPHILEDMPFGTYQVTLTPPAGYECGTISVPVTIDASTPDPDVEFTCVAPTGSFVMSLSGLGTGQALAIELDGPGGTRTGQLGLSGLSFTGLQLGNFTWGYEQLAGNLCTPPDGEFTLGAGGQQATAQVACSPSEGTLRVTVNGATANVAFSGPETGGAAVGSTPVDFTGLAPGVYIVSISNPTGFTCVVNNQQVTVTAGGVTSVQFTCTPVATLTAVLLQLPGTIPCPGVVTPGTYQNQLLNPNTSATVGTTTSVTTIGSPTFCGTGPDRLGFGPGEGYRFGTTFTISGEAWNVLGFGLCATSTFSGGTNLLNVTYRNAGLTSLGSDQVTTGPGCFWGVVPGGTAFVDVTASGALSLDINTIRFWR